SSIKQLAQQKTRRMNKNKISFQCSECTYTSIKWIGCCPECNQWDSFKEVKPAIPILGKTAHTQTQTSLAPLCSLDQIPTTQKSRMLSGIDEWDRVLGGGIMPGSLLILTGDPGIGKSTLLLQVCN